MTETIVPEGSGAGQNDDRETHGVERYMKIGKIPERVLKRSVLKQLPIHTDKITGGAGVGEDCAVFAPENGDCTAVCVNTTTGAAEHIGSYAVHAAVNNIAAGGADPKAILVAAVFPENTEEARLRTVMKQIGDAAGTLGITVAGGHTEISGGVSEPVLSITGIGQKDRDRQACIRPEKHALADKDIVMTKWAGLAGTAWIAQERREELLTRYPAYFIDEAAALEQRLSVVPEAATAGKSGVPMMHDASRGGIFAALWELAERAGVGLSVHLKAIPIRQETVEICNFYDINPYELAAGGSLLMLAENGYGLVRDLAEARISAAVIGRTDLSNDKVIINGEERRFLEPPKGDGLDKVFANAC